MQHRAFRMHMCCARTSAWCDSPVMLGKENHQLSFRVFLTLISLFSCSRCRQHVTPLEVLRKREVKWLDMLENWEKWMSKRFKKVNSFYCVKILLRALELIPNRLLLTFFETVLSYEFCSHAGEGPMSERCSTCHPLSSVAVPVWQQVSHGTQPWQIRSECGVLC